MFDFRYHALSLVAVFLALGIGIVLGVTIGDSLVSEAEKSVRASLRSDVVEARDMAESLRVEVDRRDDFIEQAVPRLVDGVLEGRQVAVVSFGDLPEEVSGSVREALEAAGGEIDSTSIFESPLDVRELGRAAGGRFSRIGPGDEELDELGFRIGGSLLSGGTLVARLERRLDERFRGDYERPDAVVVVRQAPEEDEGEEHDAARALEQAVIAGIVRGSVPVVGVQREGADPSQIPFFEDAGISSVDGVDGPAGRAALVFALRGADGSFGLGDGADGPLPEAPGAP